jgi:protein SCO1/2
VRKRHDAKNTKHPNRVAALALLGFALVACERGAKPVESAPPGLAASAEKRYPLRGQIRSLDIGERQVIVAHDEITGYMAAMTMPFRVRDEATFNMLGAGDVIEATLVVSGETEQLVDVIVKHKGDAPTTDAPAVGPKRGDALPEVTLLDQDGRRLTTAELRGKAVVLTFIFTRCPLPDFCPRMGKNFAAIETLLAGDPPLKTATRLLSISFDAAFDTPAVLKKWGRPYQPGADAFTHWQLAAGSLAEIKKIATFFGLDFQEESGQFTHNLRTAVITPDGKVFRVYRGNDWKPEEIVTDLSQATADRQGWFDVRGVNRD